MRDAGCSCLDIFRAPRRNGLSKVPNRSTLWCTPRCCRAASVDPHQDTLQAYWRWWLLCRVFFRGFCRCFAVVPFAGGFFCRWLFCCWLFCQPEWNCEAMTADGTLACVVVHPCHRVWSTVSMLSSRPTPHGIDSDHRHGRLRIRISNHLHLDDRDRLMRGWGGTHQAHALQRFGRCTGHTACQAALSPSVSILDRCQLQKQLGG